jgi:hypothetical protein
LVSFPFISFSSADSELLLVSYLAKDEKTPLAGKGAPSESLLQSLRKKKSYNEAMKIIN